MRTLEVLTPLPKRPMPLSSPALPSEYPWHSIRLPTDGEEEFGGRGKECIVYNSCRLIAGRDDAWVVLELLELENTLGIGCVKKKG
jgi:hypothetical protein